MAQTLSLGVFLQCSRDVADKFVQVKSALHSQSFVSRCKNRFHSNTTLSDFLSLSQVHLIRPVNRPDAGDESQVKKCVVDDFDEPFMVLELELHGK
jgi:hypothetical protein